MYGFLHVGKRKTSATFAAATQQFLVAAINRHEDHGFHFPLFLTFFCIAVSTKTFSCIANGQTRTCPSDRQDRFAYFTGSKNERKRIGSHIKTTRNNPVWFANVYNIKMHLPLNSDNRIHAAIGLNNAIIRSCWPFLCTDLIKLNRAMQETGWMHLNYCKLKVI